MLHIYRYNIVY